MRTLIPESQLEASKQSFAASRLGDIEARLSSAEEQIAELEQEEKTMVTENRRMEAEVGAQNLNILGSGLRKSPLLAQLRGDVEKNAARQKELLQQQLQELEERVRRITCAHA